MSQFLGRYELLSKIGSGGMAEVFLARLGGVEGFSRQLVIKRMRPELADRDEAVSMFLDEARLCAKLHHPNLVQVFDLGEADGTFFIAMEFVDGPHLGKLARHLVKKQTPLPLMLSAYVINRASDGIHFAHTQPDPETGEPLGIVHRDISPHNILISRFGDVKVADFGVAKATSKSSETKSGVVKGKIAYMSPEQVYGDELDGRSDVFALGIVLFEITTSRRLFKHKSELVSMQRITQEDAPAPSRFNPDVDVQLEHIILKALQRDRERRYGSALDLKADLDEWISKQSQKHLKSELAEYMKVHADDLELPREPITGSVSRSRPTSLPSLPRSSDHEHASLASDEGKAVALERDALDGTRTVPARKSDVHLLDTLIDPGASAAGVPTQQSARDETGSGSQSNASLSTQAYVALKTNLSPHGSRFIGRRDDLKRLKELFAEGQRVVTIVGPAGTGKTRLALRYAERQLPDLSARGGGAWLCDLTTARQVDDICKSVGLALNVPLTSAQSTEDAVDLIGRALASRGATLLVLDNFEHVVDYGPATVQRWASMSPDVQFLITSRELLRLPGEVCFDLGPLRTPTSRADAADSEAVQLFVERAAQVKPGYSLSATDKPVVADIVQKLDGIPLAIELAAARMSVLKPQKILERLGRRFDLLKGGGRNLSPRQATLRGAVDWSWELLTPVEQDALAQCAVFRGGFMLEAAEEVLDLTAHEDAPWPLDVVQALKDKSLLRAYDAPEMEGETRFTMYESIRAYAAEKLDEHGSRDDAEARHARYFLASADEWGRGATTHGGWGCLQNLQLEYPNILAVHERSRGLRDDGKRGPPPTWATADMPLQVSVALEPLFAARGPFKDAVELCNQGLAAAGEASAESVELRVRTLSSRGRARRRLGDIAGSREDYQAALDLCEKSGSEKLRGPVIRDFGVLGADEGRLEDAIEAYREAIEIHRRTHDRPNEAITRSHLAFINHEMGRLEEARDHYEGALQILREVGDQRLEGVTLCNFGGLNQELGDLEAARRSIQEGLELLKGIGDRTFVAPFTGYFGQLCHELGKLEDGAGHLQTAVETMRETGNLRYEGMMLGYLAAVYADLDRLPEAERTIEHANERTASIGDPRQIEVGRLQQGFVELAQARGFIAAKQAKDAAPLLAGVAEAIASAEAPGADGGPSSAGNSDDIRRVLRLLKPQYERVRRLASA